MSSSEVHRESIHQYILDQNVVDPNDVNLKDLGIKWMTLCKELDIDLLYIRCKMDSWFIEAYNSRNELLDTVSSTSGRVESRKDYLYNKFFDDFEEVIKNEEVLGKIQTTVARDKIKNKYKDCPGDWVDIAVKCVSAETDLLNTHLAERQQCEQIQQVNEKMEQDILNACQIKQNISDSLKALSSKASEIRCLMEQKEENQSRDRDVQVLSAAQRLQNGTSFDQGYFRRQLQQIQEEINSVTHQVTSKNQEVFQQIEGLHSIMSDVVKSLVSKVKAWQREFQFDYAELAASPDLESQVAPWCARAGKIIHDVLHESLVSWQNNLSNLPCNNCEQQIENCSRMEQTFRDLMLHFIQKTFVVTEQGNFFIKTGNKRFPKFCVRVLAADHFNQHSAEATAHFVSEEALKACWKKNDLDLRLLQKHERKLKSSKLKFSPEKGKERMECSFQNLQFEQSFKRLQKDQNKQVHEEKYRVVFTTVFEETKCWTLSLPLVVTTASNQEGHSLASIMWQCFSTNVFDPTEVIPEERTWLEVAEMLQAKMARLSSSHKLSSENIRHLKNRLFGEENVPDEKLVSLTEFCWNTMCDTDFTFWKWFLGIYNLIEQYLLQFWHDGLIMGFVKKEVAEKMLEKCKIAGTFILRFSDNYITNSDGRRSIYGRLASCVVVLQDVKVSKRNCYGEHETVKRRVVEHVDVADFRKLSGDDLKKPDTEEGPGNNLANILKETSIRSRDGTTQIPMYCYLYPSGKSRQELFDKYCKEGCSIPGYRNTQVAYIAKLEQTMSKMNIAKKEAGADMNLQQGAVKKARRSTRSTRESSQSNVSVQHGSPFHEQSPCQTPSQSPGYPGSSPAQSVPSPVLHLQNIHDNDSVFVQSDTKSQLPTVFGEGFTKSTRGAISSRLGESYTYTKKPLSKPVSGGVFPGKVSTINPIKDETDNIHFINSSPLDPSSVGVNQSFTDPLFNPETAMEVSVLADNIPGEEGSMFVEETDSYENPENQVLIFVQNGNHLDLNRLPTTETVQHSPPHVQQAVFDFLSSNLSQSQFQQVQTWLTKSPPPDTQASLTQVSLSTSGPAFDTQASLTPVSLSTSGLAFDTQASLTPVSFSSSGPAFDSGLTDCVVSTSSGSSGGLLGFRLKDLVEKKCSAICLEQKSKTMKVIDLKLKIDTQLAAMGSGDIDPNFTQSITEQDMHDETT